MLFIILEEASLSAICGAGLKIGETPKFLGETSRAATDGAGGASGIYLRPCNLSGCLMESVN
jgi:hypothetical protein